MPDGDYQLFFVPPGDNRLIPRWWRTGDNVLASDTLEVRSDLSGIDVTLVEGHLVHGRLTSASGKPAEHVLVCVDTRFPTGRICRPTDENGEYSVAVRSARFLVQFRTSPASGVVSAWYGGGADPRSAGEVFVDADVRVDATLAIAALIQATMRKLYKLHSRNQAWRTYGRALIMENKWRAARYGLDGMLIDFGREKELPCRELILEYLDFVDDVVDELGCRKDVAYVQTILDRGTGAQHFGIAAR